METNNKTTIQAESGKQEVFIIREFEAPRELVFRAFSDPKIVEQWLGPRDITTKIERWDAVSGGSYRYLSTNCQGYTFGFHGVIHEVTAPERVIQTFEFEGLPERGHVVLETTRFEELPGNRTKVIIQSVFQSLADREGMLKSGMERGVYDSHVRLDELFAAGL